MILLNLYCIICFVNYMYICIYIYIYIYIYNRLEHKLPVSVEGCVCETLSFEIFEEVTVAQFDVVYLITGTSSVQANPFFI